MGLAAEEMLGRVIFEGQCTKYSKLHTFVCKLGGQKENSQEKWNYCSNIEECYRNIHLTNISRRRLKSSMLMTRVRKT